MQKTKSLMRGVDATNVRGEGGGRNFQRVGWRKDALPRKLANALWRRVNDLKKNFSHRNARNFDQLTRGKEINGDGGNWSEKG